MKSVDWEQVGRLVAEVDLSALERGAGLLWDDGHEMEFRAALDALSSLTMLRAIVGRRGDVPWEPIVRAVRDAMAGRGEVDRG